MLLGFTIELMYTNNMFSCIFDYFKAKISLRISELMFVYLLLAAVTLQAGNAQCDRSIVVKQLL